MNKTLDINYKNFITNDSILAFFDKTKLHLVDKVIQKCLFETDTNNSVVLEKDNKGIEGAFCPRMFDGFMCWDKTPVATDAFQKCPEYIIGFNPRRLAFKRCTDSGSWFTRSDTQNPWTNYSNCIDRKDLRFRGVVNNIFVGGYSLSVIALILALFIFIFFRTLRCTRVRVHKHLFTSFTLNNILWIMWYKMVVNRANVIQANPIWCQALHVLSNYFMVASYLWMFCEGLHLHFVLVVVFFREELVMTSLIIIGWGVSFGVVMVYAAVRYNQTQDTDRCWVDESSSFWVIIIPVGISLVGSLVFLVNVVKVLLAKLQPAPSQQIIVAAKKATRAAMILIPLFGLHLMLLPLRPASNTLGEKVYDIFSALLISLQGLCVSILYCFTNNEVISVIRTYLTRRAMRDDLIAMTARRIIGVTGGDSLAITRDLPV